MLIVHRKNLERYYFSYLLLQNKPLQSLVVQNEQDLCSWLFAWKIWAREIWEGFQLLQITGVSAEVEWMTGVGWMAWRSHLSGCWLGFLVHFHTTSIFNMASSLTSLVPWLGLLEDPELARVVSLCPLYPLPKWHLLVGSMGFLIAWQSQSRKTCSMAAGFSHGEYSERPRWTLQGFL